MNTLVQTDIETHIAATKGQHVLTAPAGVLAKAFAAVARASAKGGVPILECVLLETGDNSLRVTGTDLELDMTVHIPVECATRWQCAVPASGLVDAVRRLPADQAVTLTLESDTLTVRSGRYRATLQCRPTEDFPIPMPTPFTHEFQVQAEILRSALSRTVFCAAQGGTRPYLCGLHLHTEGDELICVATDGGFMGRVRMYLPEGAEGMPGIIVSPRAVSEMVRIMDGREIVTLAVSENRIRLTAGDAVMTSKLVQGPFPAYAQIIPQNLPWTLSCETAVLSRAIEMVSPWAESGRTIAGAKSGVLVMMLGDTVTVETDGSGGTGHAEVAGTVYTGEPRRLGALVRNLLPILETLGEHVNVALGDAELPLIITSPEKDDALYLAMLYKV